MTSTAQNEDYFGMQLALEQARLGLGLTSPNPPVGAVIMANLDGKRQLLAASYHECAGEAHAERRAIAAAKAAGHGHLLRGSCIYVTLEPCSSHGRTPPCTDAIITEGITRVVYACADPDCRHQGRARLILEAQGIEVLSGVLERECEALLRPWAFAQRMRRPWVVAKVATSLDARLSRQHTPWLSGKEALSYAHQLRAESDAILIGGETLRRDDPSLTIRQPMREVSPRKKCPWRIVVTRDREKLPAQSQLFCDEHRERTIVVEHVEDWPAMLHSLYEDYGIVQLMLECGGKLLQELLNNNCVQEWVQVMTPYICGGPHELVSGQQYLNSECQLEQYSVEQLGRDMIIRGIIQ